jgi:hypothetical protein
MKYRTGKRKQRGGTGTTGAGDEAAERQHGTGERGDDVWPGDRAENMFDRWPILATALFANMDAKRA